MFLLRIACLAWALLSIATSTLYGSQSLSLPSLAELENMVEQGPEVLSSMAALARDEHIEHLVRQRSGPKFFAGISYGYSDEPESETAEERISYNKVTARAGVSFPILGTWTKEKIEILQSELRTLEGRILAERTREMNLISLRKAYMVLWGEGQKRRLLSDFLKSREATEALLSKRVREGFLLEADRLEFLSVYDVALRDVAASSRMETQALQVIRLATGQSWQVTEEVPFPTLPGWDYKKRRPLGVAHLTNVRYNNRVLDIYGRILEITKKIDRDGTVEFGATAGRDFPGTSGAGVSIRLTVEEPFASLRAKKDEARLAAQADLERHRAEELKERLRLEGELEDALSLLEYGSRSVQAGIAKVQASTEAVRVHHLRYDRIGGDAFEKLEESRYAHLRAALELVDAQILVLQAASELVRFFPEGEVQRGCPLSMLGLDKPLASLPNSPVAMISSPEQDVQTSTILTPSRKNTSVYVWNAAPFLKSETRHRELKKLQQAGFCRILLSFDGQEIRSFSTNNSRLSLMAFLEQATYMGIQVDLLLGDPTWILPEHRMELVQLIRFFAPFPFKGVHVDLEPDSLPGAASKRSELALELLQTLKVVRDNTDLPLSLSVHPRYLEGELGEIMGRGLVALSMEDVAVMFYSTNVDMVTDRFGALLKKYPDLPLLLAQSVESILSPRESYATLGRDILWSRIAYYNGVFQEENYRGVVVQAWKDYEEMVR
ncbi:MULTISPECIES: hypothetical protein [Aminobacterium]|jgi:outer membrane protein TolC|uniref:hypothetical protein n=1 Tax=Aminobacterium TaxID=81466 RepID=UPI00257FF070|nr:MULTISPECIES: hypothetical protein [unclassified Aminobacterium]